MHDRVRPSLVVPYLTALPINAASWNNCMRDVFVTNCDRSSLCSSHTDPGTTYSKAWTSSNGSSLAQEQLWRQPAKMLDAQPLMMLLYPLPTWRHLGDLCQRAQDQNLRNQKMCFDAVKECPHVPEKMDHILTLAVGQLDAHRPRNMCSER